MSSCQLHLSLSAEIEKSLENKRFERCAPEDFFCDDAKNSFESGGCAEFSSDRVPADFSGPPFFKLKVSGLGPGLHKDLGEKENETQNSKDFPVNCEL